MVAWSPKDYLFMHARIFCPGTIDHIVHRFAGLRNIGFIACQ
jgi:hypothetical protein